MATEKPLSASENSRESFLHRTAAEVFLLLDYLSGRPDHSLAPQATKGALGPNDQHDEDPDTDLKDPTRLVRRVMRIKYPPRQKAQSPENDKDRAFESDAAFLIRARDALNRQATPASGATIAFTSMVCETRQRWHRPFVSWVKRKIVHSSSAATLASPRRDGIAEEASLAFPQFRKAADCLAIFIRGIIIIAIVLLMCTLAVSAYAAWGKALLDTVDAIRRDLGAVRITAESLEASNTFVYDIKFLTAQDTDNPIVEATIVDGLRSRMCDRMTRHQQMLPAVNIADTKEIDAAPSVSQPPRGLPPYEVCDDLRSLSSRVSEARSHLQTWAAWFPGGTHVDEQWAPAALSTLGNYVLPIMYALLGSMAFVLRRFHERLARSLLTPRDLSANLARLALGCLIGACIGLFFSSTASASQAQGVLGLAVSLPVVIVAFLAGYGVEAAFRMLDALMKHVFKVTELGQDARS